MIDAQRVRAWIEEQQSIRPGVDPSSSTELPLPPPISSSSNVIFQDEPAGDEPPSGSAGPSSGYVRADDVQSIVDARVDLIRVESRREIERLAQRVQELEKRVAEKDPGPEHELVRERERESEPELIHERDHRPESDLGDANEPERQGSATPAAHVAPRVASNCSSTAANDPSAGHQPSARTTSVNDHPAAPGKMDVDDDVDRVHTDEKTHHTKMDDVG